MESNRFRFTKARLNTLQMPREVRQRFYYDEATRGLCISLTNTGTKAFYVLRKFKGRTERVHIGRYPDTTIAQARERAGQVNSQFDAGCNANEIKRRERGELTLEDLYREYMERHAYVYNRRPDLAEDNYRLYLSHWAKRRLSLITKLDVQRWHARTGRDRGQRTANNALSLLRAMYNRGIDWDLFNGPNPTKGVRKFKEVSRERFLHPDELKRFLEALKEEPNPAFRDLFLLLLLTGARKSNVLAMRWQDINLDSSVWTIPQTKIGEPQMLPLSPQAVEVMRHRAGGLSVNQDNVIKLAATNESVERPAVNSVVLRFSDPITDVRRTFVLPSEFVFPGIGCTGHLRDPKKAWSKLLDRAEIRDFRIHDLRRTHGSYMAATGANQFVISRALGHKDVATTAIYARLDLDPVRAATERATDVMLADVEGLLPLPANEYSNS